MKKTNPHFDISNKLRSGVLWQYCQTLFVTAFNFATGIVLARILDPADFGIFAAVTAFTNILMQQVVFGWPAALLRTEKLDEPLLSTVFWTMEGTAFFLIILVAIVSPFLGKLYADPRFQFIMLLLCLNFIIRPFNIINGSFLRWEMRYDLISRIQMAVVITNSFLGVSLAFKGFGVYSLVWTGISSSLMLTMIMAYFAPWRPKLIFSWGDLRSHFSFSFLLHLNSTLNLVANRIDNMLIGKFSTMQSLGYYVKAFSLGRMPVELLVENLYQMFFTALCHKRKDRTGSIRMFQKMLFSLTCIAYLPLMVLFLVGDSFIVNLYGVKWRPVVVPMQIMLIGSFVMIISVISGAFSDAQNLVKQKTKVECLNVVLTIVAVCVGSKRGLNGIAVLMVVKSYIVLYLNKNILSKGIRIKWSDIVCSVWPNLIAVSVAMTAGKGMIWYLGVRYDPVGFFDTILIASISSSAYIATLLLCMRVFITHFGMQILSETLGKLVSWRPVRE